MASRLSGYRQYSRCLAWIWVRLEGMDLFVGYREVFDPSGHDNQFSLLKMHFGVALLDSNCPLIARKSSSLSS